MRELISTQEQDNLRNRTVYLVCGSNHKIRESMSTLLKEFGLHLLEKEFEVNSSIGVSPFIGDILDAAFERAQAIVVLLINEDKVRLREKFWNEYDADYEKEFWPQPGQDQIFEAGYAFGKSAERTILVQIGKVRPFSDIAGRFILQFDNSEADRFALWHSLHKAGCMLLGNPYGTQDV